MSDASSRRGPVGVAVIGAGNISKQYLDNLTVFRDLKVHVIADLFEEAAEARAKEYGVPEWGGVDAALNHPDVEIIVNLTIPAAHVEVATAAINAAKSLEVGVVEFDDYSGDIFDGITQSLSFLNSDSAKATEGAQA